MTQVVGLDIGTSAVRAAELEIGVPAPRARRLRPGRPAAGRHRRRRGPGPLGGVRRHLPAVAERRSSTSKSVVVGIAGLRAITRELDLPVGARRRGRQRGALPVRRGHPLPAGQDDPLRAGALRQHRPRRHRRRAGCSSPPPIATWSTAWSTSSEPGGPQGRGRRPRVLGAGAGPGRQGRSRRASPRRSSPSAPASRWWSSTSRAGPSSSAPSAPAAMPPPPPSPSALDLPLVDAEAIKRHLGELGPRRKSAERAVQPAIARAGRARSATPSSTSPRCPDRAPIARVLLTGGGSMLHGLVERAADPGAHPGRARLAAVATRPLADRPRPRAGGQHRPGAGHAHRPGASRAQPVGQEVQPGPARDRASRPSTAQVTRKAIRGGRGRRAPGGGVRAPSASAGPQRPERREPISTPAWRSSTPRSPPTTRSSPSHNELRDRHGPGDTVCRARPSTGRRCLDQLGSRTPAGLARQHLHRHRPGRRGAPAHDRGDRSSRRHRSRARARSGRFTVAAERARSRADAHFSPVALWIDESHGVADVQPARRELGDQRTGRGQHHRVLPVDAWLADQRRQPHQERRLSDGTVHAATESRS